MKRRKRKGKREIEISITRQGISGHVFVIIPHPTAMDDNSPYLLLRYSNDQNVIVMIRNCSIFTVLRQPKFDSSMKRLRPSSRFEWSSDRSQVKVINLGSLRRKYIANQRLERLEE
ncbi:hypothetical protein V1477_014564 [Vespula maculifrons]|uniref:Uncharacterized protein n=1 Tax=Vespula maculifrons TaxID=7453 RepID=A0ABD2BHV5_VESMC